jgi:hypothetical protein
VVADPANLRLFVDESLMGIGKALAYARRDLVHAGHPLIPGAPTGALDTEWIPAVAAANLAVISRDRHVRTRTAELERLRENGLRVFYIAGKRDLTSWGYLVRLVRRWDELERIINERGAGPWFMAIHETRITEVVV